MNITDFSLLRVLLRNRSKYISINIEKLKLLPKVTQRYVCSKIKTFVNLLAMPHFQNYISNWPFLTVFRNSKSNWNIKIA